MSLSVGSPVQISSVEMENQEKKVEKRKAIEMEDYDLAKAKKVRGFVSIFFSCPLLFYFKAKLEACKHDMLRGFKRIHCW